MLNGTLLIVTGASRGIGRAISIAASMEPCLWPIRIALISRSEEQLRGTADQVRRGIESSDGEKDIDVSCHSVDLSDLDTLEDEIHQTFEPFRSMQFDRCWFVNNAGSVGPLGAVSTIESVGALRKAIDLNVTSSMWLSTAFFKSFAGTKETRIVNISSLCAIDPFSTMAVYCAGKASRDMFHSVLAKEASENGKHANLKVLNYAPGAVATDMTDELADCDILDKGLGEFFNESRKDKTLIRPDNTAKKLVKLLVNDSFTNGAHVDYWDDEKQNDDEPE